MFHYNAWFTATRQFVAEETGVSLEKLKLTLRRHDGDDDDEGRKGDKRLRKIGCFKVTDIEVENTIIGQDGILRGSNQEGEDDEEEENQEEKIKCIFEWAEYNEKENVIVLPLYAKGERGIMVAKVNVQENTVNGKGKGNAKKNTMRETRQRGAALLF